MIISASIKNGYQKNEITVTTDSTKKEIAIPGKPAGQGSSVNGGELLFLALATCFCNDTYREAARRKIDITSVEVAVSGEFGQEGEPASKINYEVRILSPNASSQEITDLIHHVDGIAEIHNTLRKGVNVSLKKQS
jgi:organic hydroperoxide reductase OsmC/OhrA